MDTCICTAWVGSFPGLCPGISKSLVTPLSPREKNLLWYTAQNTLIFHIKTGDLHYLNNGH